MEGKSHQKIKLFSLLGIGILCISVLFAAKSVYEDRLLDIQKQELSVIYPEYESGLTENLDFYHKLLTRENLIFFLLFVGILGLLFFFSFLLYRYEGHKKTQQLDLELNTLYEQLCGIREGRENSCEGRETTLPSNREFTYDRIAHISDMLKELEYDISTMKYRLSDEENRTKSLITDISHQLKTPLASIRMSHDLSLSDGLTEEERLSFFEIETKEILKMETLLDELVKLSRLENSMIKIFPQAASLKDTIREAVSIIFMKANAKKIEISLDMEKDVILLHDHKWTTEALSNIIENAVKYSPENSSVRIRVSQQIKSVIIEVEDDGIGIPNREENEIFKRFYRGSNARKFAKDGAGVGLYLARNIIEQQGGTIVVKRKSSHGSIFKITLPL